MTWLPAFHDMGLTNGIIQPLLEGRQCYLMSPQSFLQRPLRWLQAISRYSAAVSGGPNFAYELCIRRTTPEQREALDLSSWYAAYNGAEPVRVDTLSRFTATFAACGFRPRFFYPCYGLAEATLMVSGGGLHEEPVLCTAQAIALEHNRVVETSEGEQNARTLVGCGHAMPGTRIVIVDPKPRRLVPPIPWANLGFGPDHRSRLLEPSPRRPINFPAVWRRGCGTVSTDWRFGILKDGELFVTGRLKDLIIIDGRNVYPQDIELTVEQSHPAIRPGCCAAFSVDVNEGRPQERLIVVAEVDRRYHLAA